MTLMWKSICGSLIAAAVIAGASGLVLSRVTAAEVSTLKDTVSNLDERDRESSKKLERVDQSVSDTKASIERIEHKLDRILEQTSQRK